MKRFKGSRLFWLVGAMACNVCLSGMVQDLLSGWNQERIEPYWSQTAGNAQRQGNSEWIVPSAISNGPSWSWRNQEAPASISASPLIDKDENVYIVTMSGDLHKFSSDGKLIWTYSVGKPVVAAPVLANGAVHLITDEAFYYTIACSTGMNTTAERKIYDYVGGTTAEINLIGNIVVIPVRTRIHQSNIYPEATNDQVMGFGFTIEMIDIMASNDPTYVQGYGFWHRMHELSMGIKWQFEPDAPLANWAGVHVNGRLVFSDVQGTLYILDVENGKKLTQYKFFTDRQFAPNSIAAGPLGRLYVGTNLQDDGSLRGMIYAVNADADPSKVQVAWSELLPRLPGGGFPEIHSTPAIGSLCRLCPPTVVVTVGESPAPPSLARASGTLENYTAENTRARHGMIMTFDAATGEPGWTWSPPAWTRPAAAGEEENAKKRLSASGMKAVTCATRAMSSPIIGGDGTVYVGFMDGKIYAIRDGNADGVIDEWEVSSWDSGSSIQASVAVGPGMLAVASCDGLHVFSGPRQPNSLQNMFFR